MHARQCFAQLLLLRVPPRSPPPSLRTPTPATPAAAAASRRVRADAQAPAAPTDGGHTNSSASASGRVQGRGQWWVWRVVDVFMDAMVVVGSLPLLLLFFAIFRWLEVFLWCLAVACMLLLVHPELHG